MGYSQLADEISEMVTQSFRAHRIRVSEEARAYVVGVLSTIEVNDLMAEDGRGSETTINQRWKAMENPIEYKCIGDQALMYLSFFYENIRRRGKGQVRYYERVGTLAYERVGVLFEQGGGGDVFFQLAHEFPAISTALGDLRLCSLKEGDLARVLREYETTHDQRYLRMLQARGIYLPTKSDVC